MRARPSQVVGRIRLIYTGVINCSEAASVGRDGDFMEATTMRRADTREIYSALMAQLRDGFELVAGKIDETNSRLDQINTKNSSWTVFNFRGQRLWDFTVKLSK